MYAGNSILGGDPFSWTSHLQCELGCRERLVRDRFQRGLLIEYLRALGIHADDPGWFGDGVLFQERARWERRTKTLEPARRDPG